MFYKNRCFYGLVLSVFQFTGMPIKNKKPPFRKLRGYTFDPSLSLRVDTAFINNIVYKIPWEDEDKLKAGSQKNY